MQEQTRPAQGRELAWWCQILPWREYVCAGLAKLVQGMREGGGKGRMEWVFFGGGGADQEVHWAREAVGLAV